MGKFYSVATLSEHISETPEGFLICRDVPITRTGELIYSVEETPIKHDGQSTRITRTMSDIADPDTIASFEGKPVTLGHPDDFVSPDTWKQLAVGIVQNVRAGDGVLLADLLITDREAIDAVKSGRLREVSCGYEAEYEQTGEGEGAQKNILGNHVAIVVSGRAGSECAIFDAKPTEGKRKMTLKDKLLSAFGRTIDEAITEEVAQEAESLDVDPMVEVLARLASIEALLTKLAKLEEAEQEAEAMEAEVEAEPEAMDECKDAETISRAEILAPGIAKTGDFKKEALKIAHATTDGKPIIDSLLAGRTLDSVDCETVFVAAAEMLKGARRQKIDTARVTSQARDSLNSGLIDAATLNEINKQFYKGL